MRLFLALVVFASLALACGGGGGASDPGAMVGNLLPPEDPPADDPPPVATDLDTILGILQDCLSPDVEQGLALLDLLKELFAAAEIPAGFEVTSVNLVTVTLGWSLDIDGAEPPEATGTIQCVDEDGKPTLPLPLADLMDLMEGKADLFELVQGIEDGITLLVDLEYEDTIVIEANASIVWKDGWPHTASGVLSIEGEDCTGTLSFEDVGYEIWEGTWPSCELDLRYETTDETLEGTLTLDGTSEGVLEVTLDGVTFYRFTLDLATGAVTEQT